MTFDEWLDEIEVFSLRRERLYDAFQGFRNGDVAETHIIDWLRAAYDAGAEHAQMYKDGYDAAMRIVKSTYPDKFPDTYFICGEGGEKDLNNLPERIHVCPAYGCDFFQIYERTDKSYGPEY